MVSKQYDQPINSKAAIMAISTNGKSSILHEDVCLPVVVIKQQALNNNIHWMQSYANTCGVSLVPHGKTTMTPAIFKQQIAAGAWGIGVGSAYQAKVAVDAGVVNIVMANQLIGKANMKLVSELKKHNDINLYCCVDSKANALALSNHFLANQQQMCVLLELGVNGGRCGCRTEQEAIELAQYIASLPGLVLAGVEFYEGVIHSDDEQADIRVINEFIARVMNVTKQLGEQGLFAQVDEVLVTGAGSVWYDIVCQQMKPLDIGQPIRYAVRPGCYITHDKGIYQQSHEVLKHRDKLACDLQGDLISALELCAFVQSLPEPGLAIIGFGKRDAAFDAGLPQPIAHYRNGQAVVFAQGSMMTVNIMDQHAMLTYDENVKLQIGDILAFGTSHPCLTFDKWRQLYLVDDEYNIVESVETYF